MSSTEKREFSSSSLYDRWKEILKKDSSLYEEKIPQGLTLLRKVLENKEKHSLSLFWKIRRDLLSLFDQKKENSLEQKVPLWRDYLSLLNEARQIQEQVEQEAKFAIKHIFHSLETLCKLTENFSEEWKKVECKELPFPCEFDRSFYREEQQKSLLLKQYTNRFRSLKEELAQLDTRPGIKISCFDLIRKLRALFFSLQKSRMESLHEPFLRDLQQFITENQVNEGDSLPKVFRVQNLIKELQTSIKWLFLDGKTFSQAQTALRELWNQAKKIEREKRKERGEKRPQFEQNYDQLAKQIEEVRNVWSEKGKEPECLENLKKIFEKIHSSDLEGRRIQQLKREISLIRKEIETKREREEEKNRKAEEQRDLEKKQMFSEIEREIMQFLKQSASLHWNELNQKKKQWKEKIHQSSCTPSDRKKLSLLLSPLSKMISEKKKEEVFELLEKKGREEETFSRCEDLLVEKQREQEKLKEAYQEICKKSEVSGLSLESSLNLCKEKEKYKQLMQSSKREIEELYERVKQAGYI